VDNVRALGIRVQTIHMARELSPKADLASLVALYRYFKVERFDVVHTHTPKAGIIGPIAAKLAGVPIVVHTIHGLLFHDRMPAWKRWIFWIPEKITATFCDYLLSQSREDMDVAVHSHLCSPSKIRYVGNGIDVSRFSPARVTSNREYLLSTVGLAQDQVIVGSVGRLVYEKGFGELFQAAEELTPQFEQLGFVVIGPKETDQKDAIDPQRIAALRRGGSVHFLDWCDDMPSWYSIMDIFAAPSHREGIPRACMEAAAMGIPVVASDIRGCREVVKHGETGFLVPLKNPKSLAGAITRLLHDEPLRKRMGENGRHHIIASFNNELVAQRVRDFYSVLGASPDQVKA